VLETINRIGSAVYGPVLGVFALGVLAPRLHGNVPLAGLVAGLVANVALSQVAPGVSWLWWNPAGFIVTCSYRWSLAGSLRASCRRAGRGKRRSFWWVHSF
jgi:hypothetical protein